MSVRGAGAVCCICMQAVPPVSCVYQVCTCAMWQPVRTERPSAKYNFNSYLFALDCRLCSSAVCPPRCALHHISVSPRILAVATRPPTSFPACAAASTILRRISHRHWFGAPSHSRRPAAPEAASHWSQIGCSLQPIARLTFFSESLIILSRGQIASWQRGRESQARGTTGTAAG